MKFVFADTIYWIAIVKEDDQWHDSAKRARDSLGNALLLTTDEILIEFLAALSSSGESIRTQAVKMARAILANPNIKVVPQTRDSFLRGIELYNERPDKAYSLVDCISMNTMKSESVVEILTNDHHFEQEGFRALITPT